MQQPDHDIRIARTTQATPRRVISLGLVGALHLILVYALVSGLAQTLIQKLPDEFKVATVQDKPEVKPPPPPPPPLEQPPPPFVPPPDIVIESAPMTNAITTQDKQPVVVHQSVATPVSIGRPHQCADRYPDMSMRLKEAGTTVLAFTVGTDGSVSGVSVAQSSGYPRLDDAAVSCAGRWRYKAATQDGVAQAVSWKAQVQWVLPK
jgi:protein TonB